MEDQIAPHPRVLTRRRPDEGWVFLREAARDLRTTGALVPSSSVLARALTEPVRDRAARPLNILEAGAGTGAVTRALLSRLSPGSRLDVVEANPRFADRLHHLVRAHPRLAGHRQQVHIHARRVQDLETDRRYDVIVSGLPFANFTPGEVETIMGRYLELLHPGGTLAYFGYLGAHRARAVLSSRARTGRHGDAAKVLEAYQRRYATGCRTVWANVPPAKVWQLTRPAPCVPAALPTRRTAR